jgi:excisionase family DNA binding protein
MSEQLTSTHFTPAPQLEPLQVEVTEAARLLGYSRSTIYEMLNSGELPSTRHGSSRRIPVAALRAWMEAHTQQNK